MNYVPLQSKATDLLTKFGASWSVSRSGVSLGYIKGLKTLAQNSGRKVGMVLASDTNIEILFSPMPILKPGDNISDGKVSYVIATVEKVEPASTSLLQKVTAS